MCVYQFAASGYQITYLGAKTIEAEESEKEEQRYTSKHYDDNASTPTSPPWHSRIALDTHMRELRVHAYWLEHRRHRQ